MPFEVIDDDFFEGEETADVTLTSNDIQRRIPTRVTITIVDNDCKFVIIINAHTSVNCIILSSLID